MAIRIIRLGSPRERGEGLRVGTVRFPPRGVPKAELGKRGFYDVWFPNLAPSAALVRQARSTESDRDWNAFVRRYRAEMKSPESRHVLDLLAALSHGTELSIGCYCEDERRCHRSILRELLAERGAEIR